MPVFFAENVTVVFAVFYVIFDQVWYISTFQKNSASVRIMKRWTWKATKLQMKKVTVYF